MKKESLYANLNRYRLRKAEEGREAAEIREAYAEAKAPTAEKTKGPRCTLCPVVDRFPTRCGTCEGT